MRIGHSRLIAALSLSVAMSRIAWASPVDFDFTISYSGSTISGRLIGLDLDGDGNGTEVDPTSVLIFGAPTSVGLPASPGHPYLFIPHLYERSTLFSGTFSSTTPGVYGFQVSHFSIAPASQNLLMSEAGNDVTLVFNFGQTLGYQGGVATYGIQAEEDALWPAINTFVTFTPVIIPEVAVLHLLSASIATIGAASGVRRWVKSRP